MAQVTKMGFVPAFCLLALSIFQCVSCEKILAKVAQGWLSGEKLVTVTADSEYYSFKGIPFAKPPVGTLRFKAPEEPEAWNGVRNATAHGALCPQMDLLNGVYIPGNEDCLFLNVYTPNLTPDKPLPVMAFIHGGGFKFGSGDDDLYGPDFLVSKAVVLVTLNYRLDVLGFLCLGTAEVPGNAGLKDQVMALKWIQKNIHNFGGNCNDVTLFGESAGATAVGYHLVSPMSKGLFQKALLQSGVPDMDCYIEYKPIERAIMLGKLFDSELNLLNFNASKLLITLQGLEDYKPLLNKTSFIAASEEITHVIFKFTPFTPVIEGDFGQERFLTKHPYESLDCGEVNTADVMLGYTSQEALIMVPFYVNETYRYIDRYSKYPEMLVPSKILIESPFDTIFNLGKKISDYYFGTKTISEETMPEFVTFNNFAYMVYDIHRFIRRWPQVGKVFFYKFSIVTSRSVYSKSGEPYGIGGSSHFDDLFHEFDPKLLNMTLSKNTTEYEAVQLFSTIVTNFAKYSNPTPDSALGISWPEFDTTNLTYVNIGSNLTVDYAPDNDHIEFWKCVFEYVGMKF